MRHFDGIDARREIAALGSRKKSKICGSRGSLRHVNYDNSVVVARLDRAIQSTPTAVLIALRQH
jgi:hypothetical protein